MMKTRLSMAVAVMALGAGLAYWQVDLSASAAAGEPTVMASAVVAGMPAVTGDYEYVGSNKCKKCHIKQHKSWADTKMGKALDTLQPGNSAELKTKHNLDPQKDYSTDSSCLACHTTGFGHAGGYVVPDEGDKKAVKHAKNLANVGCESCHGPGSAYIEIFEEIMKSKRTYKVDELYAAGLTKMDAAACTTCHNEKSPTFDASVPFDYAKKNEEGTHEHIPLTQRE